MKIEKWELIKDRLKEIENASIDENWDLVSDLGEKIDVELRFFFEKVIPSLDEKERLQVKSEGDAVIQSISRVMGLATEAKAKANKDAKKIAQGRKGISAYKST